MLSTLRRDFNSIKVQLKRCSFAVQHVQAEFQFHKGTIKT